MIVRDVVLSSEPRPLRPTVRVAGDLADNQRRPTRDAPRYLPPDAPVAAPPPPIPPDPPKPILTAETASSWLTAQSADIRTALAQSLATEVNTIREQGRAQGVELGRTQALQEIARRVESSLSTLAKAATAADEAFGLEAVALADSCADIVSEAFLKIAGEHLATREAVLGAVVEVIKRVKDSREVTVRVSSQDFPLLREYEAHIQQALGSRHSTLVADPRVSVGGCLVESDLGTLDGRLEVQLRELFETIRAAKAAKWADA
jgi:flagellar assembly protein FliH